MKRVLVGEKAKGVTQTISIHCRLQEKDMKCDREEVGR
jgi:hypothetical protein